MKRMRCATALGAAVLVVTSGAGVTAQEGDDEGCAQAEHPGGDWAGLNGDVMNSRHQEHEDVIGPGEVAGLVPAWATSMAEVGVSGGLDSTPTVANGCIYVGTPDGWVVALDADTGALAWRFSHADAEELSAGRVMATSHHDGLVYFGMGSADNLRSGALDADTGELAWVSEPLTEGSHQGRAIYSSPVVFDLGSDAVEGTDVPQAMVFVTLSEAQGPGTRVPYYLLDAKTGAVVRQGFPIPEEDLEHGYAGGGIWATAAVDVDERYIYVGTSDPEAYTKEHPHNAAILQIDADPRRASFGEVVGAQKGRYDGYVSGGDRHEACDQLGDDTPIIAGESSPVCGQLDIGDFGASPNLFVDEEGHKVVTAMQKSGVFFAVDTRTMTSKWEAALSYPLAAGNAATAAVGDGGIYLPADPTVIFGLSTIGWVDWAAPSLADAARYQPVSLANGVVYSPATSGVLQAWDAASGVPLLARSMAADVGDACTTLGGGVAVARNTVYAQCDAGAEGGWVVAYRLG